MFIYLLLKCVCMCWGTDRSTCPPQHPKNWWSLSKGVSLHIFMCQPDSPFFCLCVSFELPQTDALTIKSDQQYEVLPVESKLPVVEGSKVSQTIAGGKSSWKGWQFVASAVEAKFSPSQRNEPSLNPYQFWLHEPKSVFMAWRRVSHGRRQKEKKRFSYFAISSASFWKVVQFCRRNHVKICEAFGDNLPERFTGDNL